MKIIFSNLLIISLLLFSCGAEKTEKDEESSLVDSTQTEKKHEAQIIPYINTEINDSSAYIVAKKISYPVTVKPTSKMDDWEKECIKDIDKKTFVDIIFKGVKTKRLKAYNYITDEELSSAELQEMEKKYSRRDIGKIQFEEEWFFDNKELIMIKRIKSVMLAYENKTEDGEVRSYTAGIKVYLNSKGKNEVHLDNTNTIKSN